MNCIYKLYDEILNEAFTLEKSIYEPVMRYYIDNYRKFKMGGMKRVSPEKFPVVTIPLDVGGTKFEKFKQFSPQIKVELNNSGDSMFYPSRNLVVLSFKDPIREVVDVIEHEIMHYFQFLYDRYFKVKYAENIKKAPNHYSAHRGWDTPRVGGLSKKELEPENLDVHGNKLSFTFVKRNMYLQRPMRGQNGTKYVDIEIEARTPQKAYKKLTNMFFTQKVPMTYGQYDRHPITASDFRNKSILTKWETPSGRRTLHSYRPIEYWTDLVSNLRHLQYDYRSALEKQGKSKEEIEKALNSEKDKAAFFKARVKSNKVFPFGSDIHPNYRQSYLSRLYNYFVSSDIPLETYEYTKEIEKIDQEAKNQPIKVRKTPLTDEKFLEGLKERFNITANTFDDKIIEVELMDWSNFSNMEDGNADYVIDNMGEIGLSSRYNRYGAESFKIKRSPSFVRKLFSNLRKLIETKKKNSDTFVDASGVKRPSYYNALYFAYSFLTELRADRNDWGGRPLGKEFKQADPIKLFEYLIGIPLSADEIKFLRE